MAKKTREELLAARAARQLEAEKMREAREAEELELEDQFSQTAGKRGEDFEIVVTPKACIVVRKPEYGVMKRWNSVPASKTTEEDMHALVNPSLLHPVPDVARALFMDHPGVLGRCVIACLALSQLTASEQQGKF